MKELAIDIINQFGYFGIFFLTAIESIIPIIPAEFILTLGGVATTVTKVSKEGIILFATMGELTGALTLYLAGHHFSQERLERLIAGRFFRLLRITKEDIEKSKTWFQENGKYTVLFSKCIPVVGSLIAIPAGMANMNIFLFLLFSFIGIGIWNTVLVMFGATIKKAIDILMASSALASPFNKAMALIFIACFIIAIFYLVSHMIHGKWKNKENG